MTFQMRHFLPIFKDCDIFNITIYLQVDEHGYIEDQRQNRDRKYIVGEMLPPGSCKDVNTIL